MPRPSGLWIKQCFTAAGAPNGWEIRGTVAGIAVRRRAQSRERNLAHQETITLEQQILKDAWLGERRGVKKFSEAALAYLKAEPRSAHTGDYVDRLLAALGPEISLGDINNALALKLRDKMLASDAQPSTYLRQIVTPLRAILRCAADEGWCDLPRIKTPKKAAAGRTEYLLPDEAERLIVAAAPHLQPLLIFLLGTGARMAEAVYLDWRDVDLGGAWAIFWPYQTKGKKRRDPVLPPRVVAALANLPHREGPVFISDKGRPYADRGGAYGGQIKKGWRGALIRAGLAGRDPELTPHDLRHTWASWHYALHHDVLKLRDEGGWSSIALVERYAHPMKGGDHRAAILRSYAGYPELIRNDCEPEAATA